MKLRYALGLMSGTSGDGLSLALGAFSPGAVKTIAYRTYPYPKSLREQLARAAHLRAPEISKLHYSLGSLFAALAVRFLKTTGVSPKKIAVIGSHGHTVYHGPADKPANTFQVGEPSFVAEATGIPVVSDFRPRDIAAGGGGAPLIPYFDQTFFGRGKLRALQNIGGIGNVTLTGLSVKPFSFDTGPGNCLIDWAAQTKTRGRVLFDRDGQIAKRGRIDLKAVRQMAAHPYFRQRPPKSTGRELFNDTFIPAQLKKTALEDLVATLTYFTALTIHQGYTRFLPKQPKEIIVSGGGALNATLMQHLQKLFSPIPVFDISRFGIHVQAKEPLAFAFFALRALRGQINHSPAGTGARTARILGKITPASR